MNSRTTVAIDNELRNKLKKLSAVLDITQVEVIKRALFVYEKEIFKNKDTSNQEKTINNEKSKIMVEEILKKATEIIWKQDPIRKAIQEKLHKGPETIDDFILNDWDSGLE